MTIRNMRLSQLAAIAIASFGLLTSATSVAGAEAPALRSCDPQSFERIRDGIIDPLMTAMMAGDVQELSTHLSDKMANRYHTLLTQNSTYPDYLRNHFADADYELQDVLVDEEAFTAVITVFWPQGNQETFEVDLGDANPILPRLDSLNGCP